MPFLSSVPFLSFVSLAVLLLSIVCLIRGGGRLTVLREGRERGREGKRDTYHARVLVLKTWLIVLLPPEKTLPLP